MTNLGPPSTPTVVPFGRLNVVSRWLVMIASPCALAWPIVRSDGIGQTVRDVHLERLQAARQRARRRIGRLGVRINGDVDRSVDVAGLGDEGDMHLRVGDQDPERRPPPARRRSSRKTRRWAARSTLEARCAGVVGRAKHEVLERSQTAAGAETLLIGQPSPPRISR